MGKSVSFARAQGEDDGDDNDMQDERDERRRQAEEEEKKFKTKYPTSGKWNVAWGNREAEMRPSVYESSNDKSNWWRLFDADAVHSI